MENNHKTELDPGRLEAPLSRMLRMTAWPGPRALSACVLCIVTTLAASVAAADPGGRAGGNQAAMPADIVDAPLPNDRAKRIDAAKTYLAHIDTVYLGIRSCTEMSAQQKDQSFLSIITIEQARKVMKAIDAASAEVGIDSNATWAEAAPRGEVTAEALKTNPPKYLSFCQRMGSLFRVDQSNLQVLLQTLGAKTVLIQKDY